MKWRRECGSDPVKIHILKKRDCTDPKLLLIRYFPRHIWLRSTTTARQRRPKVAAAQMLLALSMKPALIRSIEVLGLMAYT